MITRKTIALTIWTFVGKVMFLLFNVLSMWSWEIDGETVETVSDFIFGGSKITADGDCSHENKTLAPWKKSYDRPRQHIKKQKHYFAN